MRARNFLNWKLIWVLYAHQSVSPLSVMLLSGRGYRYGSDMQPVSVVIPCFRGETTLEKLVTELERLTSKQKSPSGHVWRVQEVILVHDGGSEELKSLMGRIAKAHDFVRTVWLTRNYGQHAATMAGMSHASLDWVATVDEDGQHNPADIGSLLDAAILNGKTLVYGKPTNAPSHGFFRNTASKTAKTLATRLLAGQDASLFQSFRLINGDIARMIASRIGPNVYLDIALGWFVDAPATAPIMLRDASSRKSGYSTSKLIKHFWMLLLSIGTRTMRWVTLIGLGAATIGGLLATYFFVQRLLGGDFPAGWASQITVTLVSSGLILFCLGLISEYIGGAVNRIMGKPTFAELQAWEPIRLPESEPSDTP